MLLGLFKNKNILVEIDSIYFFQKVKRKIPSEKTVVFTSIPLFFFCYSLFFVSDRSLSPALSLFVSCVVCVVRCGRSLVWWGGGGGGGGGGGVGPGARGRTALVSGGSSPTPQVNEYKVKRA